MEPVTPILPKFIWLLKYFKFMCQFQFVIVLVILLSGSGLYAQPGVPQPTGHQPTEPEIMIQQQVTILEQNPESVNLVKVQLYPYLTEKSRFIFLRNCLLVSIQKSPDNRGLVELLDWDYLQQKDFGAAFNQEVALDRRGNEDGEQLMGLGSISFSNEAYPEALRAYRYVVSKGKQNKYYREARFEILNCLNAQLGTAQADATSLSALKQEYELFLAEFGRNTTTATAVLNYAVASTTLFHNPAKAISLLEEAINYPGLAPSLQAKCKLELGDIYLTTGRLWDAALLYGQVDKSFREDPLGQEAKFRAAKIYFYSGDFALAKSQLDVLKTATSELIANDALDLSLLIQEHSEGDSNSSALKKYARAELLILQNKLPQAEISLDSISRLYPGHSLQDEILMAGYKIDLSRGQYQLAGAKLQQIITRYPKGIWGDDALFHLAVLDENQLKIPTEALRLYQQLIIVYPGSFYVPQARKAYRRLRGDKEF